MTERRIGFIKSAIERALADLNHSCQVHESINQNRDVGRAINNLKHAKSLFGRESKPTPATKYKRALYGLHKAGLPLALLAVATLGLGGCSKPTPPVAPLAKDTAHIHETCFSESLYEVDICYLIGGSVADLRNYVKRHHGEKTVTLSWDQTFVLEDGTDAYQFHITSPLGEDERFYVWMHDPTPRLMWHETMHVTFDILFVRQVYYKSESEEAFAYLGGWIFEEAQKRGVRP